jgi:ketosteroid isomerase-like protein
VSAEANKALVPRYFRAIEDADYVAIEALLADEVRFRLPPSVPDGAELANRHDVMRNIRESIAGLYDTRVGLHPEIKHLTAKDDRVAAKIAEFHEHLDTLYAFRALFEPAGIVAPEDVTWLPDASGSD